jgi:hypothetical protein
LQVIESRNLLSNRYVEPVQFLTPLLIFGLGILSGCSGSTVSERLGPACAEIDDFIPTVAHISWESDSPGAARVSILDESGNLSSRTAWTEGSSTEHQVNVLGLEPGSTARLLPEFLLEDGSILALATLELEVPPLPVGFPEITAGSSGENDGGLILTHTISANQSMVLIVDRDGSPVWYTIPGGSNQVLSADLSLDGQAVWFTHHPTNYVDTEGVVHHMALDGSFYNRHEIDRVHSGATELPEGGFGYLKKQDAAYEEGVLLWDEIWERNAQGEDRQLFSLRDHFEPEPLCSHWELDDVEGLLESTYFDWTHSNSLVLSEDQSAWYLMVRHFDALLKIDRQSGELLWTLGGPYSDFELIGETATLSHPHFSQISEGKALIFDNGTHREPPSSRLVEIFFDEDTLIAEAGAEIRAPDGQHISLLGDAIYTPSGNLMGSWSSRGMIDEYNSELEPVWQLSLELGFYSGRISWLESLEPG